MRDFILTSEAVTSAHPDKICDQISDAVIDAWLMSDPPRTALLTGCVAECALASGVAFLSIRHGGALRFDPAATARRILDPDGDEGGTGAPTVVLDIVDLRPATASSDLEDLAAQTMTTAFGHACDHTPALVPWPIWAAQAIAARIERAAARADLAWLAADAQVQIAARFADRQPVELTGIAADLSLAGEGEPPAAIDRIFETEILAGALEEAPLPAAADLRLAVRAARTGGPARHSGLTGRKGANDGYGGFVRQSSSALSGKDPTRIDRIAPYAARQAAVSVVAAGLARECEVQLSYAAGEREPVSVEIDCFGSAVIAEAEIVGTLRARLDFAVGAIIERLGLMDAPRAAGGHFYRILARSRHVGRADLDLPWDRPVDLA